MFAVFERPLIFEREFEEPAIEEAIRRRLGQCHYHFAFNKVTWQYEDGRLTLSGRVASFYLKQVLQELLRGLNGVHNICNEVDVVSSSGLSSVRRRDRRECLR